MPGPLRDEKLPRHVGVIMDGNGRWAEMRGLPRFEGHRRGAERAREVIKASNSLGIEYLTLYIFSLENWQRPPGEVTMLMRLLERYLGNELQELLRDGIRFRAAGELWRLPDNIQSLLMRAEQDTVSNTGLTLVASLSYGGRNEIVRAARKAVAAGMKPEDLTEESFADLLDTAGIPDPDLVIRTSGEMRLSNFLTWQTAYSELYFTPVHWPDFTAEEFERALTSYTARDRRFGAVKKS